MPLDISVLLCYALLCVEAIHMNHEKGQTNKTFLSSLFSMSISFSIKISVLILDTFAIYGRFSN